MRPTSRRLTLVLLAASLAAACARGARVAPATRPSERPFPAIQDYSAGASRLTSDLAASFKARDASAFDRILAPGVVLKGAALAASAPFVSPSGLRVERFVVSQAQVTGSAVKSELMARREKFQGVVISTVRIAGVEGSGARRTLRIHSSFAGIAPDGSRRQDESWWRWEVEGKPPTSAPPSGAAAEAPGTGNAAAKSAAPASSWDWTVVSMTEERRTIVTCPQPLLRQLYPTGDAGDWISDSELDAAYNNTPIPGDHDTGGVAVLDDCVNGGPCLLFGSGMGLGVLSRGRLSDEGPFEDRAELLGLKNTFGEAKAILTGDFNNDGIPDLLVTFDRVPCRLWKGRRLLQEVGEDRHRVETLNFEDVTAGSGLQGLEGPYRGAAALDADRDGRLDLYLVQFGDTSKTGPSSDGRNGLPNRFFRNISEPGGPIRFADETASSGSGDTGWGLSASAADYDGDAKTDLYVVNNFGRNVLYRNATESGGPVRFSDVGKKTGTDESASGAGVAWGDYDGDGQLDLFVTNYWSDESWIIGQPQFPAPPEVRAALRRRAGGNSLFHNEAASRGRFARVSEKAGVLDGGWAWGAAFGDIDGDGRLDLVVANGMLVGNRGQNREVDFWNELGAGWADFTKGDWKIDFGPDGITGPQPERLFLNLGDGTFAEASYAAGLVTMADLRGIVASDINGDGAPDLVAGAFLGSPVIFENMNAGAPGWVRVVLQGTASNWDAVGAVVRLTAGGRTQTRQVVAGGSFLSDAGRGLDFGLGGAQAIDRIEVLWPSGRRSVTEAPAPRRGKITISEPPKDEKGP
jgi:hypothetical protein